MMNEGRIEFKPVQHSPFTKWMKIKLLLWHIINITIFRWSPFFCRKFRVFLLRLFGAKIDWTCSINRKAVIDGPWFLTMGYQSSLEEDVWIRCRAPVTMGRHCIVGRGVNIMTGSHRLSSPNFDLITAPVTLEDNVWLATRSFVHMGVTMGEGSVAGACSVIAKSVEPWIVVAGNPAVMVKKRVLKA